MILLTHGAYEAPLASLRIDGELDVFGAAEVRRAIRRAARPDCSTVLVDFEGVTFVDVSALGVLARAARDLADFGCRLCLLDVSAATRRLCDLPGLAGVFDVPSLTP